jgi:hypothetical protein
VAAWAFDRADRRKVVGKRVFYLLAGLVIVLAVFTCRLFGPDFEITDPADGAILYALTIDVKGSVASDATVEVNGIAAAVENGSFCACNVPLNPGENAITATATDANNFTRSHSITVICDVRVNAPEDVDLGLADDEQQGGGGLVGEGIRILNGNVVEQRQDLAFASPNRLGLSFAATYNSRTNTSGPLGFGWAHAYSCILDPHYDHAGKTYIKILDTTGRGVYFQEEAAGLYTGAFKEKSHVTAAAGGYT